MTRIHPGRTYGTALVGGKLIRVEVPTDRASYRACRRVEDFPPDRVPADAGFDACSSCGARIVFNPATPPEILALPAVCLQCDGIEPLPFGVPS